MPVGAERGETLISSITAVKHLSFPVTFSPPPCPTSLKIQTVRTSFTCNAHKHAHARTYTHTAQYSPEQEPCDRGDNWDGR